MVAAYLSDAMARAIVRPHLGGRYAENPGLPDGVSAHAAGRLPAERALNEVAREAKPLALV